MAPHSLSPTGDDRVAFIAAIGADVDSPQQAIELLRRSWERRRVFERR